LSKVGICDISPFFYTTLEHPDDIYYRQGVIQMWLKTTSNALVNIQQQCRKGEIGSRENRHYHYQQRRWELECFAVLPCRDRVA
jgi:hypothetical protein